jgi:hypothetical protein
MVRLVRAQLLAVDHTVRCRAPPKEYLHHRLVPVLRGDEEGRQSARHRLVHIRPPPKEYLHHPRVPAMRGDDEGRQSISHRLPHLRAPQTEYLRHRPVPVLRGDDEWRYLRVHIGACLQKNASHRCVPEFYGQDQRSRFVVAHDHVHRRA